MPSVLKDDVLKLKTPQLDALLYLKGIRWGQRAGTMPVKWERVWQILCDNCDVNTTLVSDTLWEIALRMTAAWCVADLVDAWAHVACRPNEQVAK